MNNVSERVEIYLCCRNLRDLDVFSKSDPYIKISYKRDFTQKQFAVLGNALLTQAALKLNRTISTPTSKRHSSSISSSSPARTSASISMMMTEMVITMTSLVVWKLPSGR